MSTRVAYVIAFSAPPVMHLDDLLRLMTERGWDSYVILSPTAATWVDVDNLAEMSGHPVRVEPRKPQDPDPLPPADAIVAAPLTFNSVNKWATGISDTLALGLLNEALGLAIPITAGICAKDALCRHPVYTHNVGRLTAAGVEVIETSEGVIPHSNLGGITLNWDRVLPR